MRTIEQVNVELCTHCNLHCLYCPLDHGRPQAFLSVCRYYDLLDDLVGCHVEHLVLSHSAEALQHPGFKHFLDATAEYRRHGGTGEVVINSNMTLMDEDVRRAIIDSGAVDRVVASIDGYDYESFERLRPPADFATIRDNTLALLRERDRPKVWINNCVEDLDGAYSHAFRGLFSLADRVVTSQFHDWGGRVPEAPRHLRAPHGLCQQIRGQLVLFADGRLGKCCFDLNGETAYADSVDEAMGWRRARDIGLMRARMRPLIRGCERCRA